MHRIVRICLLSVFLSGVATAYAQPNLSNPCGSRKMQQRYYSKGQIIGSQADGDIMYVTSAMLTDKDFNFSFTMAPNTIYTLNVIMDGEPRNKMYPHHTVKGEVVGMTSLGEQQSADAIYDLPQVSSEQKINIKLRGWVYYDLRDANRPEPACAIVYIVKLYSQAGGDTRPKQVITRKDRSPSSRKMGSKRPPDGEVKKKETPAQVMFSDWTTAQTAYKWKWLETPKDDDNIYRRFDSGKLLLDKKSDGYSWTYAETRGLTDNWTFGATFTLKQSAEKSIGTGMVLVGSMHGNNVKGLFIIHPKEQTYWFGIYNNDTKEWTTINGFEDGNLHPFSKEIQTYNDKGEATNSLHIERNEKELFLYINDVLVETVRIDGRTIFLDYLDGIGFATKNKQSSLIEVPYLSIKPN